MTRAVSHPPSQVLQHHVERLAASREQGIYRDARNRVLAIKNADAERDGTPSPYWQAELGWFEYMLDAGPLVVDKLRWHTHHVTGLKAYDYRESRDPKLLTARLEALHRRAAECSDMDLFVPENRALGGFGFRDPEDRLFNIDTLKGFEALIALSEGALLPEFRAASGERRLAWEIGAGWGGFAYQFKTLCPNTTYVIVDLPELFLFSAVYLQTVFPEAKIRFYTEVDDAVLFDGWEDLDFVFIPHTRLDLMRPPRCDLAINMVSFQEMTTAQVRGYVEHAFDLKVPFLYSLNRERSPHNPALEGVSQIIAERYRPCEIEVLPTSYVKSNKPPTTPGSVRGSRGGALAKLAAKTMRPAELRPAPMENTDYRHLVGCRHAGPAPVTNKLS